MTLYFRDNRATTEPEPHHTICWKYDEVTLQQHKTHQHAQFIVRYGKQVHNNLTYKQACCELGAAIMHQAQCNGLLDRPTSPTA